MLENRERGRATKIPVRTTDASRARGSPTSAGRARHTQVIDTPDRPQQAGNAERCDLADFADAGPGRADTPGLLAGPVCASLSGSTKERVRRFGIETLAPSLALCRSTPPGRLRQWPSPNRLECLARGRVRRWPETLPAIRCSTKRRALVPHPQTGAQDALRPRRYGTISWCKGISPHRAGSAEISRPLFRWRATSEVLGSNLGQLEVMALQRDSVEGPLD